MAQKIIETNKKIETDDDPFYSESNIKYLDSIYEDIKNGKASFHEHNLIKD